MELMDLIFLMELPIQLPELVRTMNSISTRLRIKSSDRKHLVHGLLEFLLLVLRAPLLMLGDLPEIQEQLMEQILLEQQITHLLISRCGIKLPEEFRMATCLWEY